MVYLPENTVGDATDPDFELNDEHLLLDSNLDEEFVKLAQTGQNHLNVKIHQPCLSLHLHHQSFQPHEENSDDINAAINKSKSQPSPSGNRQQFTWRLRKLPSTNIDSTFRGADFSPPGEKPSPMWYFAHFMDKSIF